MSLLLPDQQRAVRTWVVDALADAGKPIPADRVVRAPQDAARLQRPYVLLVDTGSTARGNAPERRSYEDGDGRNYNVGTATVSITIVGAVDRASLDEEAGAYVAVLAPRLWEYELATPLRDAGLSVQSVAVVPNAGSRLAGQSQWEPRAALDVTFNRTTVVTRQLDTVQEAEITGTTDPPTPIGTFTVGAP